MTTKKPTPKVKSKKPTKRNAEPEVRLPGRPKTVPEHGEKEGPLRVNLPESLLEFLTKKNAEGLSRTAYVQTLLRREMNREAMFKGKTDLELFFTYLQESVDKGDSPQELASLAEVGRRFVKRVKRLESKIYTDSSLR